MPGTMQTLGRSAPIFNPQIVTDMMAGMNAFQQNPTINPMQRGALDEQIAFRDKINQSFSEIGKGARSSLTQQFGTQMKNLGANMQRRGLAGSSLAAVGQVDLEGARQSAIGDLENTLINAQSDAIRDLSQDFSGTLGGIGDQNANVFASLMRLLQPQVTADDFVRAAGQQADTPGGGRGGFGGGSGRATGGGYGADPLDALRGNRRDTGAGRSSGGRSSGGGGGGRGNAAPSSSGVLPGSSGGFAGFGGGLIPPAPPPPGPPGSDDDEGEGDGEDEGPKYLFGWQKSGKSRFNPMNPIIKAGRK